MAVNDKMLTVDVKKAAGYFRKLELKAAEEGLDLFANRIEVDDGKMVLAAGYAAPNFQKSSLTDMRCGNLREAGVPVDPNVQSGVASSVVETMCKFYAEGVRKFNRQVLMYAAGVCSALANYVDLLERDPSKRVCFQTE